MEELKSTTDIKIGNKEYSFRKLTLNDEIWLSENIDLTKIFNDPIDLVGLTRIMYHQLVDRSAFPARVMKDFDEEGHEIEIKTGGLVSFRDLFSGQAEILNLLNSFSTLLVMSRPELLEETEETNEKK